EGEDLLRKQTLQGRGRQKPRIGFIGARRLQRASLFSGAGQEEEDQACRDGDCRPPTPAPASVPRDGFDHPSDEFFPWALGRFGSRGSGKAAPGGADASLRPAARTQEEVR